NNMLHESRSPFKLQYCLADLDRKDRGDDLICGHCVEPILRVLVGHQLHAAWYFDPDQVGTGLRGVTHNGGQADQGGNAANGSQSISSGRIDLKLDWPARWGRGGGSSGFPNGWRFVLRHMRSDLGCACAAR